MQRRRFIGSGLAGLAGIAVNTTGGRRLLVAPNGAPNRNDGRLSARPGTFRQNSGKVVPGTGPLGMGADRDGVLVVPESYTSAAPAPLILALHGAGGAGERLARNLGSLAKDTGAILAAPDSRGGTWDAIRGEYDRDVVYIDALLVRLFREYNIDERRITIAGFSDGASYALSLGLINGDLFRRIAAFSPGFIVRGVRHGKPEVFVSHGRADPILPFRQSNEQIVPSLRRDGYAVMFRDFDGGHAVPPEVLATAVDWLRA